ncbi:hypothetical protein SDC9_104599 [bioreactor metagenome]|uniref:Uncharacterized protein n=1 Tax=bioreactor metagenome TaxID=1076179 RepID=A0A645AYB9_9ZZZZ
MNPGFLPGKQPGAVVLHPGAILGAGKLQQLSARQLLPLGTQPHQRIGRGGSHQNRAVRVGDYHRVRRGTEKRLVKRLIFRQPVKGTVQLALLLHQPPV